MKYKKLSNRQKAINRITKRLKTLKKQGVNLKVKPTKQNIEAVLRENNIKVTKNNLNNIVNTVVSDAQYIGRSKAKEIKKTIGKSTIKEVQGIKNMELYNILKNADDTDREDILEAYGY